MKPILIILMLCSLNSVGQTKKEVRKNIDRAVATDSTENVMIEFCLRDRPSYKFIREGFKRGDQYWIVTRNNRIKPAPKSWFVWDTRLITKL